MGLEIKTRTVSLDYDANRWELYADKPGAEAAAKAINAAFCAAVAANDSFAGALRAMDLVMVQYRDFGASDSEPLYHLEKLLEDVYGRG
jgi:hypothetical protein